MTGLYHIQAQDPFMETFVSGFLHRLAQEYDLTHDPLALSRQTILLPTRRAGRSLREAFLRATEGRSQILPRILPLGDVEDDALASHAALLGLSQDLSIPPALTGLDRDMRLARLILAWDQNRHPENTPSAGATPQLSAENTQTLLQTHIEPGQMTPDQAIRLARELARFLDVAQTEECRFENLEHLVPDEYADHWRESLAFLSILTEVWPNILAEKQAIDPAERRIRLIRGQARIWQENPPQDWVIAAGITGSIPATTDLLKTLMTLPKGAIVLPGLDVFSGEDSWSGFAHDPCHPQYGFTHLCQNLDCSRQNSQEWKIPHISPEPSPSELGQSELGQSEISARSYLISQALHSAITPQNYLPEYTLPSLSSDITLSQFQRLECHNLEQEAGIIALIMRQTLETPEKTAALVTTNRMLARRVATALKKWHIDIDDSAGNPLPETGIGVFLRLVARVIQDQFAPVTLLSLLKHPLTSLGQNPVKLRLLARFLDHSVLRGPRPMPGIEGLKQALGQAQHHPKRSTRLTQTQIQELHLLLDHLHQVCQPFITLFSQKSVALTTLLETHIECSEQIATSDLQSGAQRLWRGDAGDVAANVIADLRVATPLLETMPPHRYTATFDAFLIPHVVRPKYGLHPRLFIWGPLESRLQQPDIVILGGLNEGHWPLEQEPDPWLSRPMRQQFGLPPSAQSIGQSAHDFWQLCHAPQVYLTRALKSDGAPTTASRWLQRLETTFKQFDLHWSSKNHWQSWHTALHTPDSSHPCPRPAPAPPLSVRPHKLSVTRIETLRTDPYAIYAQYILGLTALDPLDSDPGLSERGTILHHILHRFVSESIPLTPEALLEIGHAEFSQALLQPSIWAFWWPRFARFCHWFITQQTHYQQVLRKSLTEIPGKWQFQIEDQSYEITAIADRIDILNTGDYVIIDYKTATLPSPKNVVNGQKPQLALEALIAQKGHFHASDPAHNLSYQGQVGRLEYWKISGGITAGKIQNALGTQKPPSLDSVLEQTEAGLRELLTYFAQPDSRYWAQPDPEKPLQYNDYAHLARIAEWYGSLN